MRARARACSRAVPDPAFLDHVIAYKGTGVLREANRVTMASVIFPVALYYIVWLAEADAALGRCKLDHVSVGFHMHHRL